MENETGFMLAAMAKATHDVLSPGQWKSDISEEVKREAEKSLISLLKSMAIHGFRTVDGGFQ